MSDQTISAELRNFIAQHVHSVEQVEILCALNETRSPRLALEIFRNVQSSEKSVAQCLKKLAEQKIVVTDAAGAFSLAPDKTAIVNTLVVFYRERRVTVTELIYKPAMIEDFAEAFRIKKRKE